MVSILSALSSFSPSLQNISIRRTLEVLAVALVYFISARVGQVFAIPPGNITPVWLPSGLMVALALIRGPGIWPGVFLGAFAGNVWAYFSLDSWGLAVSALFAGFCNGLGDVFSTVGAVQLLLMLIKQNNILSSFRDFGLFLLLVVILGAAVSAVAGVSSLAYMGFIPWSEYWPILITWWTGDAVGVLLITPLLLSWFEFYKKGDKTLNWKVILLVAGSAVLACILFKLLPVQHWLFLLSYASAPIVLITSLYLGQQICFSSLLTFAAVAVIATHENIGPFAASSKELNLLELQLFIAIMSFVICLLSITVRQRLEVEKQAREYASSLAQAQQIASLGSWQLDLKNENLWWSKEVFRIFELDPESFTPTYHGFMDIVHPEDRDYVKQAYTDSLKDKKPYEIEHRLVMSDGRVKYVNEKGETQFDEKGEALRSLGTVQDITERKLADQKILYQAHYDTLTDLPNRFLSLDRLSQLLLEADRDQTQVAIMFLDLDHFKRVNDSLGHDAGDELLMAVSQRLKAAVRAGDTVGRLGGDEFLLLLRGLHVADEAQVVAEHLLTVFNQPFYLEDREFYISASVGIVLYPGGGSNANEVLRNADLAMYRSKDLGRNNYAFFSDEMNKHVSRRIAVEGLMNDALKRKEFSVVYQVQVDVNTSRFIGAEALLRWHNAKLGDISPDEFIPIAEQSGFIVQLGQFVIQQALSVLAELKKTGIADFIIAVNLSPRQLKDPKLFQSIAAEFKHYAVSPDSLELEITEGVLMSGYAHVDQTLNDLHELGVKIALDDFGTGYASLSYLRNYPFDTLKIDRSFINDIEKHDGKELVNAAIAMAHALGLQVVAEGVETSTQLDILKTLDCDHAQGFYFSRPISEKAFLKMINQTPHLS